MFPTLLFDDEIIAPGQLRDRVLRAANGLATLDVREGDVIAVMLRNEPAAVEAVLAARHMGAYWCGLNWHFKSDEAGFILRDSGAKALIIHADLLVQVEAGIPPGLPVLVVHPRPLTRRQYNIESDARLPDSAIDWDLWTDGCLPSKEPPLRARGFMPYTSGTTGRPKGVKRQPMPAARADELALAAASLAHDVFDIDAQSICLLSAPIYHSAPASYLNCCAQSGAVLRLEPKFDAIRLLELIERDRVTHLYLVPTMYQRLLRLPDKTRAARDISSVRFVASTGSPCPPAVKQAMIDWWGPVINEAYASSETGYVTFITAREWLSHPGSAGRPVGQAIVKIYDDHGREVPPGEVGSIYARQFALADFRYVGDEEARNDMERDGLVTLGDMGYMSEDGYLYICDRKSDMVISGGVNIYPAEIEAVLSTMPGVADCAVFGIPDQEWGEALAAAIEPRTGTLLHEEEVRTFLQERLARYKVPGRVEFHERLPREDTGKIFKKKLRAAHWSSAGRKI
jgi:long-chain acyl-CoA synthetase